MDYVKSNPLFSSDSSTLTSQTVTVKAEWLGGGQTEDLQSPVEVHAREVPVGELLETIKQTSANQKVRSILLFLSVCSCDQQLLIVHINIYKLKVLLAYPL